MNNKLFPLLNRIGAQLRLASQKQTERDANLDMNNRARENHKRLSAYRRRYRVAQIIDRLYEERTYAK